jgi:hypothetical protein
VSVLVLEPEPRVQLPTVAIPLSFVVAFGPVTLPPPAVTANVTLAPDTTFELASVTLTDGGVATAVDLDAVWLLPALIVMSAAGPVVPVAVNVTGLSDPDEAVRLFGPAAGPSFQLPTVAMPLALDVAVPPVTDPPPVATAKVTVAPEMALPFASVILTDGAVATFDPATAVWAFPTTIIRVPIDPGVPVALKVTDPDTPGALAVTLFGPAALPSVQLPTVAIPVKLVEVLAPVIDPPPLTTAKFTVAPLTGLPLPSTTFTDGAMGTTVPATAVCPSPPFAEIDPGALAMALAVNVTVISATALEPAVALAEGTVTDAVSVLAPAAVPSLQLPTVATPASLVICVAPVMDPPPPVTAKTTVTFCTPFPFASATLTEGGLATSSPTVALWPLDDAFAIVTADTGPGTNVTVAVFESADPARDAEITAGPAVVDDVRVAV